MKNLSRRDFLKLTGAGMMAAGLPGPLITSCRKTERPNILFIMTDDHAVNAISAYGSKINQTPNIDRLAEEGLLFRQSFVTNSICAPSRAVLLTGKYSHLNGQVDNARVFDTSQQTFPKLLQQAGYQTAMIGKWHLKSEPGPAGFDYWNILPGQGQYYNPDFIEMGEKKRFTGYATDLTTDFALKWLDRRNPDRPFCLLLHHKAPHRNWMPAPKYLHLYDDREIPMPDNFFDDYDTRSAAAHDQEMEIARHMFMDFDLKVPLEKADEELSDWEKMGRDMWRNIRSRMTEDQRRVWDEAYGPKNEAFRGARLKGRRLAKWKYQRYIKDYLRCIASVDDNIGRVLDYLEKNNLAGNTLVVYTSDQGFYLGEHGWFDKRFMYEESLRMPLIVRPPKNESRTGQDEHMVLNLDFAPTFLDYAGVDIPEDMQGLSLRPLISGRPQSWRQAIYYHYYEYPAWHMVKRHYGIRTKKYKLIHFYHDIDAWELYDLEKDPHEMHNVADDPAYREVRTELYDKLQELRRQYKDTDDTSFLPKENVRVRHKAVGKTVRYQIPFSKKYSGGGASALTDGWRAPDDPGPQGDYKVWQGFEQDDCVAVVDLGRPEDISRIALGTLHKIEDWIFAPPYAEFYVSVDGKKFQSAGRVVRDFDERNPRVIRKSYSVPVSGGPVRYVKVEVKNVGLCPSWHAGDGGKAWLFIDEIVIE